MKEEVFTKIVDEIRKEQLAGYQETNKAIAHSEIDKEIIAQLRRARDKHQSQGLSDEEARLLSLFLENVVSSRGPQVALLASKKLHTLPPKAFLSRPGILLPLVECIEKIAEGTWQDVGNESNQLNISLVEFAERARIAVLERNLPLGQSLMRKVV